MPCAGAFGGELPRGGLRGPDDAPAGVVQPEQGRAALRARHRPLLQALAHRVELPRAASQHNAAPITRSCCRAEAAAAAAAVSSSSLSCVLWTSAAAASPAASPANARLSHARSVRRSDVLLDPRMGGIN